MCPSFLAVTADVPPSSFLRNAMKCSANCSPREYLAIQSAQERHCPPSSSAQEFKNQYRSSAGSAIFPSARKSRTVFMPLVEELLRFVVLLRVGRALGVFVLGDLEPVRLEQRRPVDRAKIIDRRQALHKKGQRLNARAFLP